MSARLFAGVACLTVVGAFGGSRWRNLEVRRASLNKEYEEIMSQLRAFDEDDLKFAEELRAKERKCADMETAVDVLWGDRLGRYEQTNLDLHAYVEALPEGLGAFKGLTNHYRYMSEQMGKFVNYDVACSKVHNLALLLEHSHAVGLPRVKETLRNMFVAEPLIQVAIESVDQTAEATCPRSVAEASTSFGFCMEALDSAVASASERLRETVHPAPVPRTSSSASDIVQKLLTPLRMDTLSRGQRELAKKRANLDKLLAREKRQLRTEKDVRKAIEHVRQVHDTFSSASPVTSSGDAMPAASLYNTLKEDADVAAALQQLDVWRDACATFLIRQQAQDALDAYQLLLSETLTTVNKLPGATS